MTKLESFVSMGVIVFLGAFFALTQYQDLTTRDHEVLLLLQQPGPVEQWRKHRASLIHKTQQNTECTLVTEAKKYTQSLKPPPKPTLTTSSLPTKTTAHTIPLAKVTPRKVTPKFKVHATSVFGKCPEKSMALISLPGCGTFWVRPGDKSGHLTILEIHKDKVVYAYKNTTGQVTWERSSELPPSPIAQAVGRPNDQRSQPFLLENK